MGDVTIRYYTTRQRDGRPKWGYWAPCLKRRDRRTGKIEPTLMAKLGFGLVDCGEHGPRAWAIAESWNQRWDQALAAHRAGAPSGKPGKLERIYAPGSLGEAYSKYRGLQTWLSKAPRTREDWERGWKHIDPVFGDVDPRTVALEDLDAWYAALIDKTSRGYIGVREAHRAMKIWRALWKIAGTMNRADGTPYVLAKDPSLGIRRKTPVPRNAVWFYDEAVQLIELAWESGYKGLSAALAVAWDTTLSPVDVRGLSLAQLEQTPQGPLFSVDRAKTGKAAIGTLSEATAARLDAYIDSLPFTLLKTTPIFHTRGGQPGPKGGRPRPPVPYQKDTLGDDFRIVREAVFPGDSRTVADFRRSGAVEATAGEVAPAALAAKMANSIDANRELQDTYQPHNTTLVRMADAAREIGRARLRKTNDRSGS